MNNREALTDIAARFPVLPTILADALDEHGPDALAFATVVDGRLVALEVVA